MARLHCIENTADQEVANRLIDQLRALGHTVTIDTSFLVPGVEWNRSLREALLTADGLVAVLSTRSVDAKTARITSQWIAADIGAARATRKSVIPVLVGTCPIPTLVDDIYVLHLADPADKRTMRDVARRISAATDEHIASRLREAAIDLPAGYQHLASAVLNCCDDTPFDKSVFVMMKFPSLSGMEPRAFRLLTDVWDVLRHELIRYGLTARRADQRAYVDQLWDNICVYMLGSRYGIAILEDRAASELNPNVTLEYGFMKALNRAAVLFRDVNFKHDRADLTGKLAKAFDIDRSGELNADSLRDAVREWLVDVGVRPGRQRLPRPRAAGRSRRR